MSETKLMSPEDVAALRKESTIVLAYDRAPLIETNSEWAAALAEWRTFEIETLDDEDAVSEALVECQAVLKKLDAQRKETALPLDRELKEFNAYFKDIAAPLTMFKEDMSKKLSQARLKRDLAEKEAKRLVAEAAESGDEDATFTALAAVPDKAKIAGTRTVYKWEFEVVEEAAVPAWAKSFDAKKATAHAEANRLKGAGPSIPGVAARYVPVVSTTGRRST